MRKKAISMILAAALGSALLAGCSSAPKETTAAATTAETTAEEKKEESKAEETKAEEKTDGTYMKYQKSKLNPVYLHEKNKRMILSSARGIL